MSFVIIKDNFFNHSYEHQLKKKNKSHVTIIYARLHCISYRRRAEIPHCPYLQELRLSLFFLSQHHF